MDDWARAGRVKRAYQAKTLVFEIRRPGLYKFVNGKFLSDAAANPGVPKVRRWTIFAAALLLLALALVVIYTSGSAFRSPLALVVVAAIGLAALLVQIRSRDYQGAPIRAPVWLNALGIACSVVAVFADVLRVRPAWMLMTALGAVICFAISGIIVLDALRKQRN
jgi:hypothetical protein